MEEKKSLNISLLTVICMLIILLLIFALIIIYYFGFVADKNKIEQSNNNLSLDMNINDPDENGFAHNNENNNNNAFTNNIIEFKPAEYVIQFNADLLGEEFESAGNEIKGESYTISFLNNNKFNIYMGFGFSVQGTYAVSNNIINCILTSASGEYSPTQEIEGKISFKIISDSEIEIIDIPKSYKIRTSEISDSGWVLTDETKELEFWPLVKGIKYVSNK